VLALLALASFPAVVQAREATGPQYETELPNLPEEQGSGGGGGHHNGSNGGGNEGAGASNSPEGHKSGGGGTTNPGAGGGSHTGQGSQGPEGSSGNPGNGAGNAKNGVTGLADNQQVKPGVNASSTEDNSSSPLVPILIAIAVLAAISIGAFYYRQRRQGAGSSVSPKAS
jgi:hypothetical protein